MFCPKCGTQQAEGDYYCRNCGQMLPVSPPAPEVSASTWVEYAGFWRRFVAYIIDGFLINAISFIIGLIMGAIIVASDGEIDDVTMLVSYLFAFLVSLLYYGICESSPAQATLGKMALGLKVTDMDGNRISFGRAMGRFLGKILSGLILCIGYLMIAFTEEKQGLHDMVARTLVVKK